MYHLSMYPLAEIDYDLEIPKSLQINTRHREEEPQNTNSKTMLEL